MKPPKPSDDDLRKLFDKHNGNFCDIAREVGRPRSTVGHWYNMLGMRGQGVGGARSLAEISAPTVSDPVELPEFPDDDIPVEDIVDTMCRRFEKRQSFAKSKEWFRVKVNIDGPIAVVFVGDPHVDDNGCNWPMLKRDCEIMRDTEAMFAVNIGDQENNWVGRMARLWADQDTSRQTAHKLTEWFLCESGIDWLCILAGNHDLWSELPDMMRKMVPRVPLEDWQATFRLVFPNRRECRIWASHDFKGHSMWNSLHGPQKAARMKHEADIYACGHKHNWAIHQEESASRDFTYWLIRARGYKYIDDYALNMGHFPQKEGASITCVIDPEATTMAGFIQSFADIEVAAEYLKYRRSL